MVVASDKDWVSEQGTMHVMQVSDEPYSVNETEEKRQKTKTPAESTPTEQPANEQAEVGSQEPADNADQRDAARMRLASNVDRSMLRNAAMYGGAALGLLWLIGVMF